AYSCRLSGVVPRHSSESSSTTLSRRALAARIAAIPTSVNTAIVVALNVSDQRFVADFGDRLLLCSLTDLRPSLWFFAGSVARSGFCVLLHGHPFFRSSRRLFPMRLIVVVVNGGPAVPPITH